jgi:hypothetical protein
MLRNRNYTASFAYTACTLYRALYPRILTGKATCKADLRSEGKYKRQTASLPNPAYP